MTRERESPVLLVSVRAAGGKATPIDVAQRVLDWSFEDSEKAADKLSLSVDNFDLANFDSGLFAEGNVIEITWGYPGRLSPKYEMVIKKASGGIVLKVEALAKSVLMNQEHKAKTYENTSRSEIVHAIAKEHGYVEDAARDIKETDEIFECVTQPNLTDAQFIRHLAQKEGFEFYVDFVGLHFHPRRMDQKPLRQLVYYADPGQGDISTFNVENDVHAKPQAPAGSVTVKTRDPREKKPITATANDKTAKDRTVLATPKVIDVDAKTLAKSQQKTNTNKVVQTTTATSKKGAEREAKAAFVRSQQKAVKLKVTMVGDPTIVGKSIIEIIFPGSKKLTGKYYLGTVKHAGKPGSYTTELTGQREGDAGPVGKDGQSAPTEAAKNTKSVEAPGTLSPKKVVDPKTLETKTIYVDAKGKEVDVQNTRRT